MMSKEITYKEAHESLDKICRRCDHPKSEHIFWIAKKGKLELTNCNICSCDKYD